MNNLLGFKGGFEQAEQSVNLNIKPLKLQHLRNRKEKQKRTEPKGPVRHCQVDQYHIMGVLEREE